MINPIRVTFLTLWLIVAYGMIPFQIIEQTGSYTLALVVVIAISIFVGILLELKIKECDAKKGDDGE